MNESCHSSLATNFEGCVLNNASIAWIPEGATAVEDAGGGGALAMTVPGHFLACCLCSQYISSTKFCIQSRESFLVLPDEQHVIFTGNWYAIHRFCLALCNVECGFPSDIVVLVLV